MKKTFAVCFTFFMSLLLVLSGSTSANASPKAKVKGYTIYKTKIKKITENKYHDWVIKGTTKAPNKAKIIATPNNRSNLNYGETAAESKSGAAWAKVKNNKFTAVVSPVSISNTVNEKSGQKIKAQIFAIKNYKKKWTKPSISKKVVKKAKNNFSPVTLTISASQAKYDNNLGKDSSSSATSNGSSSENEIGAADNTVYGKLTDKVKKMASGSYSDKELDYVTYGAPDKIIDTVKLDFRQVPLDPNVDQESIDEHITDFMEDDARKVQTIDADKMIYQSDKISKKYVVELTRNSNGEVTMIIILRGDVNGY